MIGEDIIVERLAELFVGNRMHRAVMRTGGGVADECVDAAERPHRFLDEMSELLLRGNIRGDGDGAALAEFRIDPRRDFPAGLDIAG